MEMTMGVKKEEDDLVDVGSEDSFPASDPPSYMGGSAVAGPPPHDEPAREPVSHKLSNPDEAKPAGDAPQGTDPARVGKAPSRRQQSLAAAPPMKAAGSPRLQSQSGASS
jgi:hypothetical protein